MRSIPLSGGNGFSLVRKICFEVLGLKVDSHVPELGKTIGEELITPTRIYSETIQSLVRDLPIKGLAHITGGEYPGDTGFKVEGVALGLPPLGVLAFIHQVLPGQDEPDPVAFYDVSYQL